MYFLSNRILFPKIDISYHLSSRQPNVTQEHDICSFIGHEGGLRSLELG